MTQFYAIKNKYRIFMITASDETEFSEIETAAKNRAMELRLRIPTINRPDKEEV